MVFAESFETIARDIGRVRPTLFTGVPRVYEKLHARIMEKGPGGARASRARSSAGPSAPAPRAARRSCAADRVGLLGSLQASLADRLVFAKIRDGLGGRVRYMVSGSAPLPVAIAEFFQGIGLPIIEGYGLTETSPILTVNPPDAPRAGTVGRAIPGVELRIAEDGEILARGPNIMSGYLQQAGGDRRGAAATAGSTPATSARSTSDGLPAITDRKKDLLVTSGGKKIAPQPIEGDDQTQSARRRSGAARRPAQVRRRAHRARTSPRSSAG